MVKLFNGGIDSRRIIGEDLRLLYPYFRHRGGAFTPLSIPGLQLWLKADAGLYQERTGVGATTPASSDSDPVGSWLDQSGQGFHCTASADSVRPTLKLAIQNGLPVVRFDGVDDLLQSASITGLPAITLFLLAKSGVTTSAYVLTLGPADQHAVIQGFTATKWEWFSTPRTEIATISTANFQVISTAVGSTATAAWKVGAATGGGSSWSGDLGEVLVYDSVLSAGDQTAVQAYLQSRWGV